GRRASRRRRDVFSRRAHRGRARGAHRSDARGRRRRRCTRATLDAAARGVGHMNARGFVLLPVLAFILVIALIAWGASRGGSAAVARLGQAQGAAAAADAGGAGIAPATWAAEQSDCGTYSDLGKQPFGGASYDVSYSTSSGPPVTGTATGLLASGASWRT